MARLYFSENHRDADFAKRLAVALRGYGHYVSLDIDFLVPGAEWQQQIRDELAAADGVVVLLSHNSVQASSNIVSSQWIAADVGAARAFGKFVIPVITGEGVQLPALVNDLFTIRVDPEDQKDFEAQVKRLHEGVLFHMQKRQKASTLALPPGFEHLASGVQRFREDFAYDESVFVMMKFPDPNAMPSDDIRLLEEIWAELDRVLAAYGLKARRADKKSYHDQLWENICIHILGSRYGIAVLEDRIAAELNPNVALEYGFMKALNRQVALIRDIQFKHDRADLTGKLAKPFEIDDHKRLNAASLRLAVQDWLLDLGVAPRQRV
jgi:hypothetical protein